MSRMPHTSLRQKSGVFEVPAVRTASLANVNVTSDMTGNVLFLLFAAQNNKLRQSVKCLELIYLAVQRADGLLIDIRINLFIP